MGKIYIIKEQKEKCQKVADAFAVLYEVTDVMVVDAGRFGFVKLQWFSEEQGFDTAEVYLDSSELFEELWRIWFEYQVLTSVSKTSLVELDYKEIFEAFSEEKKQEIMQKREYFLSLCEK